MICQTHQEEKIQWGKKWRCKTCNREYQRDWYAKNKKTQNERVRANNKRAIARNRQNLWDYYKSHPCVDCGESNPVVLESDHVGIKTYSITKMVCNDACSWDKILQELSQCETRCANCHRIKTAVQLGWYKGITK